MISKGGGYKNFGFSKTLFLGGIIWPCLVKSCGFQIDACQMALDAEQPV